MKPQRGIRKTWIRRNVRKGMVLGGPAQIPPKNIKESFLSFSDYLLEGWLSRLFGRKAKATPETEKSLSAELSGPSVHSVEHFRHWLSDNDPEHHQTIYKAGVAARKGKGDSTADFIKTMGKITSQYTNKHGAFPDLDALHDAHMYLAQLSTSKPPKKK